MHARSLTWLTLFGASCLLGQTEAPPVPRIIPEDPPAATEPAPRPKIIPEDPEPAPEAPPEIPETPPIKPRIIPEGPKPADPDLLPDPLPAVPDSPPDVPVEPSPPVDEPALKVRAVMDDGERSLPLPPATEPKAGIPISEKNDKNARTLFLSIPAPRGLIVDRNGVPLVQNRMAHFLGIQFPLGSELSDSQLLNYSRPLVSYIQKHTPDGWNVKDETLLEHYKNRRWLPLLAAKPIPAEATANAGKSVPSGVSITPCYLRHYVGGHIASHLLGYVGKTGGMSTQPIQNGDSLWPEVEGREGLEKKFNATLTGTPGKMNIVFSATGEKVAEEIVEYPKPGMTLVTSLDLEMQNTCERTLRDFTRRGAFVIMEVTTGDVLAMASNPDFDPNDFAFGIGEADFAKLVNNKDKPLFCRPLNGVYPPASTFKIISALAGLESGKITGDTHYECTSSLFVGDRYFHNANRSSGEGSMNVISAIKRSCNTWFYQAALATGAGPIASMATKFGLGESSGICLPDSRGRVVSPEWWRKNRKGNITSGDLCNICIGQGDNEITPLQDCAMMCGVARGSSVPRARLVRQVQSLDGNIVEFFPPEIKSELNLQPENLRLVRAGMKAVVEEGSGTGRGAGNSYVKVAGKTGTAQWIGGRHMAWFAGFMPAGNPEFAFAAVYEGDQGEDGISGGRKVAPMIGKAFEEIYKRKKGRGESLEGPEDKSLAKDETVKRARIAEDDSEASQTAKRSSDQGTPTKIEPSDQPPARETGLRGLWNRIRGR